MFTEKGQLVSSSAKSLHTSVKHISRMIWEHINCFCQLWFPLQKKESKGQHVDPTQPSWFICTLFM